MKQFRQTFIVWFASLMGLFIVLNLGGFLVPHDGSVDGKRFTAGFPCVITEWIVLGDYRETNFCPSSILINVIVAVSVSTIIALVCATARACFAERTKEDESGSTMTSNDSVPASRFQS